MKKNRKSREPRGLARCIASLAVNAVLLVMDLWLLPFSIEMYIEGNAQWHAYFVLFALIVLVAWDVVRDVRDIVLNVRERKTPRGASLE